MEPFKIKLTVTPVPQEDGTMKVMLKMTANTPQTKGGDDVIVFALTEALMRMGARANEATDQQG